MQNENDLNSPRYDSPRLWMKKKHNRGMTWDELATNPVAKPLAEFLKEREEEDEWPQMTAVMWEALVRNLEEWEKKTLELDIKSGQALVIDGESDNDVTLPESENSCWQLYKQKLAFKGFAEETIGEIERATLKILKRLSQDTRKIDPIKGLVIGNVQSGKTANMAALMAMAADWGWNMFIVLSGTIENLRIQTQARLQGDLNNEGCVLSWQGLEHLSLQSPIGTRAQDLHFESNSKIRYFTVSLKNAARLKKLIQWLQKDKNKMAQMKILVIDDEADQAGINTANISSSIKRPIYRLITAMVNGLNERSQIISDRYMAMNYIGYTATPYANILNDSSLESLYPKNFIATLSVSNEYFGPQQIFGTPDGRYLGLDIIREVTEDDLSVIKGIHKGESFSMPDSLEKSICWFICCVAAMRFRGIKKPISMLVHTSQQVQHHDNISNVIVGWVNQSDEKELLSRCKEVWESETANFSLGEFKEQYEDYGLIDALTDYPLFDEIEQEIREILSVKLNPIKLNEEGELTYHRGIHLCVDNSRNSGINDENEYLRLVYPDAEHMPEVAPAFLVIGGATLSRGLTLEGLVSTFFLRSVKQADTLMQMGRWFGYRRGYELYPRMWITATTKEQFEFLSVMDQELREEIHMMEVQGLRPDHYAAKIRNSPRLTLIRLTAKNRMQSAVDAELDFSGSFNQTQLFDSDKDVLEKNLEKGKEFIEKLGNPRPHKPCNLHSEHATVWEGVSNTVVSDFLRGFKFCSRLSVFNDIEPLLTWLQMISEEGILKDWNVVLAGKKSMEEEKTVHYSNCSVVKVTRTRKATKNEIPEVINIGALRAPLDIIADVDLDGQSEEIKQLFSHVEENKVKELRLKAGLGETPQLLLYVVDKDSKPAAGSKSRKELNAPCDLFGICVNIPGGSIGSNHVAKVCIRLDNSFKDEGDLDGQNLEN